MKKPNTRPSGVTTEESSAFESTSPVHVGYTQRRRCSGGPHPPPPGVSTTRRSSRRSSTVTLAASPRRRPFRMRRFRPGRPSSPPSSPFGRRARRSDRIDAVPARARNRTERRMPSPPECRPRPPVPGMSRYSSIRSGYANSRASTGVLRVFVMWVWTPDIPGRYGSAPSPPAMVS